MGKLCSAINYLTQCVLIYIHLFATAWTIAHQAPLSMEFSKQQYWIRLPFPTPSELPNPGSKLTSLVSLPLAVGFFFTTEPPKAWHLIKAYNSYHILFLMSDYLDTGKLFLNYHFSLCIFVKLCCPFCLVKRKGEIFLIKKCILFRNIYVKCILFNIEHVA